MNNRKVFCLQFEKKIREEEYNVLYDYSCDEIFKTLWEFKNQMYNSNLRCKKCKKSLKDMIIYGSLGCPNCYEMIFEAVREGKFKSSLVSSKLIDFFMSKDSYEKYNGKRPEYVKKYYDVETKIRDLKRELTHCIDIEDYTKCEVLKYTIEDLEDKQVKFRRKINE